MILPILISVSVAPASYFFCANAAGAASAAANSAAIGTITRFMLNSSIQNWTGSGGPGPAVLRPASQPRQAQADSSRNAHRHQVHGTDEKHAEDRPGGGLRDLVRDVRHELDEQPAE